MASVFRVHVWDRFVRVFHWTMVSCFAVAYLSEDGPESVHIAAGGVVAALVLARIVWGFIGPQHARFSDFLFRPALVLSYLRDLVLLRPGTRYLGHSPAGGASVVVLLVFLLATAASGVFVLGAESVGPFASRDLAEAAEEVHEGVAAFTLALALLHVAGVVLASFVHHENLVGAMFTGYKRP